MMQFRLCHSNNDTLPFVQLNSGCMTVVCVETQPIFFLGLFLKQDPYPGTSWQEKCHIYIRSDEIISPRSRYCCFLCHVILLEVMIGASMFSEPFNTYQDESVFLNCFRQQWALHVQHTVSESSPGPVFRTEVGWNRLSCIYKLAERTCSHLSTACAHNNPPPPPRSHATWTGANPRWTRKQWVTPRCWIRLHQMDWIKEERQIAGLKTEMQNAPDA